MVFAFMATDDIAGAGLPYDDLAENVSFRRTTVHALLLRRSMRST